jgi:cell division protein FtsI (penicillin-binding protein 3)
MRKMMEGVVLFGTGRQAQLNGYSSGGKTGTAQKIDPATRRYSKTMHVASFAGIAPVNNPVIAVAVIMDNPKGNYYGASVSAPVFTEVAQQVLEYLSVPHDIDVRKPHALSKADFHVTEEDSANSGDINAIYAAANELPADDPLRAAASQPVSISQPAAASQPQARTQPPGAVASTKANPVAPQPQQTPATRTVIIKEGKKLRVPSLIGLPVRKVIEQASIAGLEVEINGNGIVREQAPAAGTMVAPGTKIVVRCGR